MPGLMDRVARLEERMDDKDAHIAALEAELAERTRELEECRQSAFDRAARCAVQIDTIDILTHELDVARKRWGSAEKDAAQLEAALRAECSKHGDFCLCERCRMVFAAPR